MSISSRTPEGDPLACAICGAITPLEFSYPGGDACCPRCGQLLWRLRDQLVRRFNVPADRITVSRTIEELGLSSLDTAELVMLLEEDWGIDIPDEIAREITTVEDFVRYVAARESA